jgi:hypothetical protein
MELGNIIDGLQLLRQYYNDQNGYKTGADHDVLYAYPTDRPISPEDVKRLAELGWYQPEVAVGEDYGWKPENYDPGEGWAAFT